MGPSICVLAKLPDDAPTVIWSHRGAQSHGAEGAEGEARDNLEGGVVPETGENGACGLHVRRMT